MNKEMLLRGALVVGYVGWLLGGGACTFNPGPAHGVVSGGGGNTGGGGVTGGGGSTGAGGTGGVYMGPCRNLECRQNSCTRGSCTATACAGGGTTSLSGTVYDPAGKVPLYNVNVYVPNAPLDPLPEGVTCDRCGAAVSGSPIATALTDEHGQFLLKDVPVGADVPMVIQVGKWRRQVTIPMVSSCADNPITDVGMTRLPRNQSEGHLPRIALTTGNADALECLLRKIGIDDSEFTPESGSGRVNLFAGAGGTNKYATLNGGAMFTSVEPWWDSLQNLMPYDLLLHSCEGTENPTNKSMAARQAFLDYASMGGRAFLSHWHNYWLEHGVAPLNTLATFDHQNDLPSPITTKLDMSFPKGQAMANWLLNVQGSTTLGELVVRAGQHTLDSVNTTYSTRWIYLDADPAASQSTLHNPSVQYFTFNLPLDVSPDAIQCGRVVFSDIHVSNAGTPNDQSNPNHPFPTGCAATNLSPQEKALEFMLFDLSSCIRRDDSQPVPIVP